MLSPNTAWTMISGGEIADAHRVQPRMGRSDEAAAMFEQALERHTNRTLSLVGLANAHEASQLGEEVAETAARIDAQWRGASADWWTIEYSWLPAPTPATARSPP